MSGPVNLALLPPRPGSGAPPPPPPADERGFFDRLWGAEGFSFGALLDIVNPLQHIPVVGTIYRAVTGDTIGAAPRIAGGALFGGVFGLIASVMDSVVEGETGKDLGQHLLALSREGETPEPWREERDGPLLAGDFTPREAPHSLRATDEAPAPVQAAAVLAPPPLVPARAMARPAVQAENGAGGRSVPLAMTARAGRAPINLPTPQALAADPALVRQMQQGKMPRGPDVPTIDTAIRPRATPAAATFLDYAPRDAALLQPDAAARDEAPKRGAETPANEPAIPTVPPDLISRMTSALEKYQTMQRGAAAPSVSVSR